MAFLDDLNKIRDEWSKMSIFWKVFSVASFFMSALSVGSLADSVFKFKGFIVNALRVYRNVTEPVIEYINSYGVVISQEHFDVIILAGLGTTAAVRTGFNAHTMFSLRNLRLTLGVMIISGIFMAVFNIPDVILLPLAVGVLFLVLGKFGTPETRPGAVAAAGYLAAIFFVVAIGAAISEGLFRQLPPT